jgi:DNA-binding transcriptional MerR regulator
LTRDTCELFNAEATVTVMRVIKASQRLGFTLDEVANLLQDSGIRRNRRPDKGLQARAKAKLDQIDAKLAELNTVRNILGCRVGRRLRRPHRVHPIALLPLVDHNSADAAQRCDRGRHSAKG